MKILLRDFNAKLGREDIFKATIGNESLHQDSDGNGVRIVNFGTSKVLVVQSMMIPHQNIYRYTWSSFFFKHIKKNFSLTASLTTTLITY
jgi:hypothetical protein